MSKDVFFNPQPKDGIWRSEPYKKMVRALPCVFCGRPGPSEFHHVRWIKLFGTGLKPSDVYGVPACKECHEIDQQNKNIYGRRQARYQLKILKAIMNQLDRFLNDKWR